MRLLLLLFLLLFLGSLCRAQGPKTVKVHFVLHSVNKSAEVALKLSGGRIQKILTTKTGLEIRLDDSFSKGTLLVSCTDCLPQEIPLQFLESEALIDLGIWNLRPKLPTEVKIPIVSLADWQDQNEVGERDQLGAILQAQRDPFLSVAAFQFSSAFFKLRGLGSTHQNIRINGIAMNNPMSRRPNWSQWGGLNDFTNSASQQYYGLEPSAFELGGSLGSIQFEIKPSELRKGTKVSHAFSNATYRSRMMLSHVGAYKKWEYGILLSRRQGKEGYQEGTSYQANSLLFLLERSWNSRHRTWGGILYTPNRRGRSAPLTQEVFSLKGNQYNPHWGWHKGKKKNARERKVKSPFLFLSHRFQHKPEVYWQLNYGLLLGTFSQSRLFHQGSWIEGNSVVGGGAHPNPIYYQRLPSYFVREEGQEEYEKGYWARESLLQSGQLDWDSIYAINAAQPMAVYAQIADVEELNQHSISLQFQKKIGVNWQLSSEWMSQLSVNTFFAEPHSLYGASYLNNIYSYATSALEAPFDATALSPQVVVGEAFAYHYKINQNSHHLNAHLAFEKPGLSFFGSGQIGVQTNFREGLFQNARYLTTSLGKAPQQTHWAGVLKTGIHYSLSGRYHLNLNMSYQSRPPAITAQYIQPRDRYYLNPLAANEKSIQIESGFRWTYEKWSGKLRGYYIQLSKGHQQRFYFADGLRGEASFFVQEHLNEIQQRHIGVEWAGKYQPIESLQIEWAAAIGQFQYGNDPRLIQSAETSLESELSGFKEGVQDFGRSYLKGYPLPNGPQEAYSLGFVYNDPAYWRIGVYANYFRKGFLSNNAFRRTQNFYQDTDGLPFSNYDSEIAATLLQTQELPSYVSVNMVGSKSWKVKDRYFGFFISIQNLLNSVNKTGGFEQARNANYKTLLEDSLREHPLFAPKFWWTRGTTFFASVYYRFP